jgi:D-methionine transport system substrate-binding protein
MPNLTVLLRSLALMSVLLLAAHRPTLAEEVIRVGVTGGPHAQIFEKVAALAKAEGLSVKVIEFDDYQLPNAALAQGDLDLNSFQHQPFLDHHIKERGYRLVPLAKTVVFPIGLYSRKIKSLADLAPGSTVAIPADPTNGGRVLLLLEANGLLTLRPGAGLSATPLDVTANPRRLKLIELPAAQLPRALDDVTLSAINGNYAIEAGLDPRRDALVLESVESPYANVLVARAEDKARPAFVRLVQIYHSPEVRAFIQDTFRGSVIPAF